MIPWWCREGLGQWWGETVHYVGAGNARPLLERE